MKYSNTAITQLTRWYKQILIKCAVFNAAILAGATFIATPANAATDVSTWDALKTSIEAGENVDLTSNINLTGSEARITANSTSEQSVNLGEYKIDGNGSSLATNLIQATASDLTINGGAFNNLNRTTDWGSVLHLTSDGNLTINDTDFTSNKSLTAGVLSVGTAAGSITINGSTFENNEAGEIGAVGLYKAGAFENVTFTGNKATNTTGDGTGALFLGSVSTAGIGNSVNGSVFQSNTSATRAGAIGMRDFDLGNNSDAALDIDNTQFISNKAATNGGAIDNYFYNDSNNDGYAKVVNSTFTSNEAAKGGAIYNHKGGAIKVAGQDQVGNMSIIDSNFTGNKATAHGGAIYNEGVFTVAANTANVAFSGNTDSTGANDIYNVGTLNLTAAEGKVINLEGGIDGSEENKGTTNVNGLGVVQIANALKNQNVNNEGQLALNGADLSGTTIAGDGKVEVVGDSAIEDTTLEDQTFDVDEGQSLDFDNVTLNETASNKGTVTVADGASLNIKDSHVNVKVINNGILYSDPTYYTKQVVNSGTATFDGDTFAAGSSLENNTAVNLLNGTEFVSGVDITGAGTLNLVEGTMKFNNTASSNKVNVASGANWTGALVSTGSVNTQNGSIDSITGTVTGGDLYIDANLGTTATADTFGAGSTGTIKSINVTSSEYGTYAVDDTKTIALNGLTLDSNATITGMSYYTKVEENGGNLVFSDKLVNTSGIQGTGDTTTPAGDVVLGSVADTTTIGTTDVNIALDNTAKTIDIASGTATKGAMVGVESGTTNAVDISAVDSTANKSAEIDVNATTGKIKLEANDTGASKTAKVEVNGTTGTVTATAAGGLIVSDGTNNATLTAKTTGLDVAQGLTVGGTAYGITATGAGSLASLKVGGENVLTEANVAPAYSGTTMADVASYVSTNGAKIATVADTSGVINTVFDAKQTWLSGELGYDTKSTDAKTILSAAGFTNKTTGDSDVGLIDAALQLKTDKQDKLVIAADSGLKWNDANQTQLAVKVNEDKGLKVTSNGIEINAGDTMQFSTSGKLDIKYDTNTFTATTTDGLKIASKGIKAGMIDDGAVGFANLATDAVATSITGATNKVATDAAVKNYTDNSIKAAIVNNTSAHTVTLTGSGTAQTVYDTTGTADYVTANAENATYTGTKVTGGTATTIKGAVSEVATQVNTNTSDISTIKGSIAVIGAEQTAPAVGGILNGQAITSDTSVSGNTKIIAAIDYVAKNAAGLSLNNTFSGTNTFGATPGSQVTISNNGNLDVDGTFTLGSAYAINGNTAGTLDMNKNALTNVQGLTLVNGTADVALNSDTAGNLVVDSGVIANSLTIGTTGKGFDASGNATTGTLTIGAANAITGTAGSLDMNGNALTNVASIATSGDATIGGNASITGTLSAGATTISATGTTSGTPVSALSVTAANTTDMTSTSFSVTSDGVGVIGDTTMQGSLTITDGTNGFTLASQQISARLLDGTTDTAHPVLSINDDVFVDGMVTSTDGLGVFKWNTTTGRYEETFDVNDDGDIETLGTLSVAGGNFTVDGSGNLTTSGLSHLDGGVNVNDKLVIGTDGSLATDGTLSANGKALLQGGINVNNKFVVATDGTTGIDAGLTVTGATLLNNTLDVNGRTTLSDTNGLQFGTGPNVKAIDDGTTAQTSAGTNNATTLATVATVLKSAENGAYTGTATKKADGSAVATIKEGIDLIGDLSSTGISATTLAGQIGSISAVETRSGTGMQMAATNTVSANLQALDKAIGSEITGVDRSASLAGATTLATASVNDNIKALDIALGNLTYTGGSVNYTNGTGSVTSAIKTINANIGAALTSVASRGAAYTLVATDSVNQNLAKLDAAIGADVTAADGNIATGTTVNANLDSLDTAIGNRATLASKNADINAKTATSVAKGLEAAGNAIGDAQFGATHYASSATDASTAIRSLDENLFRLEDEVIDLRKDVRRGFASMAAMSAMVPNARSTGNTQLSVGTGMYSGHTGFALGGFHWFTDNLMMNVGVAYGDGDSSDMIYRAGITYSW